MRISDFTVDVLIRIYKKKLLVKILALITFRLSGRRKESIIFCPLDHFMVRLASAHDFYSRVVKKKNELMSEFVSSQPVSKKEYEDACIICTAVHVLFFSNS